MTASTRWPWTMSLQIFNKIYLISIIYFKVTICEIINDIRKKKPKLNIYVAFIQNELSREQTIK